MADVAGTRASGNGTDWHPLGTGTETFTYTIPSITSNTMIAGGNGYTINARAGDTITWTSTWMIDEAQSWTMNIAREWDAEQDRRWGLYPRPSPRPPEDQRAHLLRRAERDAGYQGRGSRRDEWAAPDWLPEDVTADELDHLGETFAAGRAELLEHDRARQEREAAEATATERAELLLLSVLTAAQRDEWAEHRRVTETAASGRVWRFLPIRSGGVQLLDDHGRARAGLCVHPGEPVPIADQIAGLLLAVRCGDEDHLIRLANITGGRWNADEHRIRAHAGREDYIEDVQPAAMPRGFVRMSMQDPNLAV